MTPEDWQKGMENEATSVEDAEWAADLQRIARWRRIFSDLLFACSCFASTALVQVIAVQFLFNTVSPTGLWDSVMGLTVLVSGIMAWQRRSWIGVGLGTLAYFPAAWLTVLALQYLKPNRAVLSPGITEQGIWILLPLAAVIAALFPLMTRLAQWKKAL